MIRPDFSRTPDVHGVRHRLVDLAAPFIGVGPGGVRTTAPLTWQGTQTFKTRTIARAQAALVALIADPKRPHLRWVATVKPRGPKGTPFRWQLTHWSYRLDGRDVYAADRDNRRRCLGPEVLA